MCGIFGYIGKRKKAPEIVLRGLKELEYRGYDSWGIAVANSKFKIQNSKLNGKKIIVKKKAGTIGSATVDDLPLSNFVLGHTRWATHGGVTDVNAHPHLDCRGSLAIIHNGIVENYDEIKKELIKTGHKFLSETDTEVAVHLIEENYQKKVKSQKSRQRRGSPKAAKVKSENEVFLEAVVESFNRFVGLNAMIVMNAETYSFVAAKNGSPLVIGKSRGENFLSSDAHALLVFTRDVYFVEDDRAVLLTDKEIKVVNTKTGKKVTPSFTRLDWKKERALKGKFDHFMLKEIYDQKKVIEQIASSDKKQIKHFANLIKKSYGTYLVGCGTAAYACLAGTYIFSTIAKRHVNFSVGSEFGYLVDFLTDRSLVIALSQSGETIDVVDAAKRAKEKKAKIAALVNVLGSTLYRMADYKLLLNAGVEKAVVSTKAFTAKLAYLILLAYTISNKLSKGQEELKQAVRAINKVLSRKNIKRIRKLVEFLSNCEHIYVIGRGVSYPLALETALKIKESSYIHAEGFAAGELKHGVIALVEKGVPAISFLPNDETYGATLVGAIEMKARGAFIIGISYKPHEVFDYYLPIDDCNIASAIPSVIAGQLIGYYLAIARQINPDKPRNLAKSVTVK